MELTQRTPNSLSGGHLTRCACIAASIALNDESLVSHSLPQFVPYVDSELLEQLKRTEKNTVDDGRDDCIDRESRLNFCIVLEIAMASNLTIIVSCH